MSKKNIKITELKLLSAQDGAHRLTEIAGGNNLLDNTFLKRRAKLGQQKHWEKSRHNSQKSFLDCQNVYFNITRDLMGTE